jgi:RND family efflux transporter MFP subunit
MILVAISVACNRTAIDDHNHEAEASTPEPLSYTLYSDKTELFVEFVPLVVGTATEFAAHFTVLGEQFRPLTEGKVTVSLVMGEKVVRHSLDEASSPGIFRLALTPDQVGNGRLVFDIETEGYTDQIIIDKITVFANAEAATEAQPSAEPTDEITYLKEQAWNVEFAHELVSRTTFTDVLKTVGQVQHAPGEQKAVSASASGYVSFIGNNAIVGSSVTRSTALFRISGGELTENNLDARYREVKANYEKAAQDLERAKKLVDENIISKADFLRYQNELEVAEIAYKTTSKNYTANGQVISSPLNGFVTSLLVQDGQYVQAGSPLAVVSSNRKLHLQANVSSKYASILEKISTANLKPVGYNRVFALSELKGRRIAYGRSTTTSSAFLPITFEFDNPGDLVPGTAAEVYLKTNPRQEVLVIPVTALMEEQGKYFVYVQTGGERFQRRTVTLGSNDGQRVQIISGIVEGERVVTKGAYQIKLSSASGAFPEHGHEH